MTSTGASDSFPFLCVHTFTSITSAQRQNPMAKSNNCVLKFTFTERVPFRNTEQYVEALRDMEQAKKMQLHDMRIEERLEGNVLHMERRFKVSSRDHFFTKYVSKYIASMETVQTVRIQGDDVSLISTNSGFVIKRNFSMYGPDFVAGGDCVQIPSVSHEQESNVRFGSIELCAPYLVAKVIPVDMVKERCIQRLIEEQKEWFVYYHEQGDRVANRSAE